VSFVEVRRPASFAHGVRRESAGGVPPVVLMSGKGALPNSVMESAASDAIESGKCNVLSCHR
jgi:hypothetical protein